MKKASTPKSKQRSSRAFHIVFSVGWHLQQITDWRPDFVPNAVWHGLAFSFQLDLKSDFAISAKSEIHHLPCNFASLLLRFAYVTRRLQVPRC